MSKTKEMLQPQNTY